jgi:hypothetical protein
MAKAKRNIIKVIPEERIVNKIQIIRGQKVTLDYDLPGLYEVETGYLKRQVRRNIERFPDDFLFEISEEEFTNLKSQFGTLSWGGRRYKPYAFTEQGLAMLSGVINSPKAIAMNIAIMRAFVEIRKMKVTHKNFASQLRILEERIGEHDVQLNNIYEAIENLLDYKTDKELKEEKWEERKRIGFKSDA